MSFLSRAALVLCLLTSTPTLAEELRGRVVAIADGDTLTLLVDRRQVKVRLAEIDTPEARQPWGTRARQALGALAARQDARVVVMDVDRYGRTVGRVYVNGVDVNAELVRGGHAWVYRQYLRDRSLLPLEAEARAARCGLWSLPERDQVPPWAWRRQQRQN
ncbi:thermonuclease family protein [Roseomonas haemaphysalidis]|uniref:Thermonuclease family protein n=1 Tax=Roseomonas haemaphysalidis TaxID=2768162 RepID=A0ABS3KW10_9PROT|nr:thermonuclease family protein [Roseomonas haemaphysalidis]MBO1081667.1 thermonuclease family protein [Roseomonas haemaphysalidis]